MKFIKLTDAKTGKPVIVNAEYISLVETVASENGEVSTSTIYITGSIKVVWVKESIETIIGYLDSMEVEMDRKKESGKTDENKDWAGYTE